MVEPKSLLEFRGALCLLQYALWEPLDLDELLYPDLVADLDEPFHRLSESQLVRVLSSLNRGGLIEFVAGDERILRLGAGDILRAVRFDVDVPVGYRLTEPGGAFWSRELLADWDSYVCDEVSVAVGASAIVEVTATSVSERAIESYYVSKSSLCEDTRCARFERKELAMWCPTYWATARRAIRWEFWLLAISNG